MSATALLLIDLQKAFERGEMGPRNNPDAEKNGARLIAGFRDAGLLVTHVKHDSVTPGSPLRPGLPGNDVMDYARPVAGEPAFAKSVNSAFVGTGLEAVLRESGIDHLVVAGATTVHCVSTSVRMAQNLGFAVTLAEDACFSNDWTGPDGTVYPAQTLHEVEVAVLSGEFCQVLGVDEILDRHT